MPTIIDKAPHYPIKPDSRFIGHGLFKTKKNNMTIQEAIDILQDIEDKSLPIKAWDNPEEKYSDVIVFATMKGLPDGDFVQVILSV